MYYAKIGWPDLNSDTGKRQRDLYISRFVIEPFVSPMPFTPIEPSKLYYSRVSENITKMSRGS